MEENKDEIKQTEKTEEAKSGCCKNGCCNKRDLLKQLEKESIEKSVKATIELTEMDRLYGWD